LAFVEDDLWFQVVYGLIVFGGIGMMTASVYGTTLQRCPLIPSKFAIGADFEHLSQEGRNERVDEIIQKTGANSMHM
jgi:hypothetical protein